MADLEMELHSPLLCLTADTNATAAAFLPVSTQHCCSMSLQCWGSAEGAAWACLHKDHAYGTRRAVATEWPRGFCSSGNSAFCSCKGWCAKSITEYCFRTEKLCHIWWHMQAMLHVGRGKQSRTIYLHSEPHILFCSSPGREMPADSCLGMRRSKHRAPIFSLCLPWLKRP